MALTGSIDTEDGVQHPNAYALCRPLVMTTSPTPKANFDFHVWHDKAACDGMKKQLLGFPIGVEANGIEVVSLVGSVAQTFYAAALAGGEDLQNNQQQMGELLIQHIVTKMEETVKTVQPDKFGDWTHTS